MLIEIAKGTVSNRGIIIGSSELSKHLEEEKELYRSYFSFDEKIKEHINSGRKSPQGYIGNFYLDYIVLDIDKGENTLEHTIQRVRTLVNSLIKDWDLEDNFQIWFSGRGFHIHMPDIFGFEPSNDLPDKVRATIEAVFPDADTKPIHARGLIRVGFSYNSKSKLYKIPIKESDIWFIKPEELLERAKKPDIKKAKLVKFAKPEKLYPHLIVSPKQASERIQISTTNPTNIVTCMQHCYNEGEVIGTRHDRILSMTSWQRRNGTPIKAVIAMMKAYAPSLEPYEVEKYVIDVYKKDYNFGCNSKVMKQFCDSTCIFYKNKNFLPEIASANDMDKVLHNFYKTNWEDRALDLGKILNLSGKFMVYPGDIVAFTGIVGINKTSLVQNIVVKLRDFAPVTYLSTEFSNVLLHRRFLQIAHNKTEEEIIAHFKKEQNTLGEAINFLRYSNITPNMVQLKEMIEKTQPKVVAIDVTNDIRVPGYSPRSYGEEEELSMQLKNIAEKYGVIILCVHHISKSSAKEHMSSSRELNMYDIKGSSGFVQKADTIIGIMGEENSNKRVVKSLKARDNKPFRANFIIDTSTFKFYKE